jgi:hypothetical protein
MESHDGQTDGHKDTRATEPPAEDTADAESAGPQGNPEVDEESLQHRQQERDENQAD